ncbi:MAG: hypothetical protein M1835_002046 [Candelina submexicana]|nr:MAG: hypothetical protein M1835_002046 [Candelina submexicana]
MASIRTASSRALKIAAGSTRHIHKTSTAANPSAILTANAYLPRSIADLKSECRKRKLKVSGTKAELIARLNGNDILNSQSFSTAAKPTRKTPTQSINTSISPPTQSLHTFKSTSSLQAYHDTSTIDLALLPPLEPSPQRQESIRVPLLPDLFYPQRSGANATATETPDTVIRPEISTMAHSGTHISAPSAMSEVTDNAAADIDPFDLSKKVTVAASKMTGLPVEELERPGVLRELWEGFLDDLLGKKTVQR